MPDYKNHLEKLHDLKISSPHFAEIYDRAYSFIGNKVVVLGMEDTNEFISDQLGCRGVAVDFHEDGAIMVLLDGNSEPEPFYGKEVLLTKDIITTKFGYSSVFKI